VHLEAEYPESLRKQKLSLISQQVDTLNLKPSRFDKTMTIFEGKVRISLTFDAFQSSAIESIAIFHQLTLIVDK
jgi:hypothetical protein